MTGRDAPIASVLRLLVRGYQLLLRPALPPMCRFEPSCSHYAMEALARHGAWRGVGLTLRRLLRCHPWGGMGYDPVPDRATFACTAACTADRPLV
jgi:uncharacterized protein